MGIGDWEGYRTKDILEEGATLIGTREMGDRIAEKVIGDW